MKALLLALVLALALALPAAAVAGEVEILAGGELDHAFAAYGSSASLGLAVSSGLAGGFRYGGSVRGTNVGGGGYNEQRLGAGISWRTSLAPGFFLEPLLEVAFIEYDSGSSLDQGVFNPEWREGNATAIAPGVKLGYRAGNYSLSLAARRQFAESSIDSGRGPLAAGLCTANCTGLDNIIYNPYAGLDFSDPAAENELATRTLIDLSVAMGF